MSNFQKLFAICGTLLGAGAIVAACSGTPRETTMNAPIVDDEVTHSAPDYRIAQADQVAGDAGVPRTGNGSGSNRPGTGSGSGMNPGPGSGTGSGSGRGPGSGTVPNRPTPTNPAPTPTPAPTNPH